MGNGLDWWQLIGAVIVLAVVMILIYTMVDPKEVNHGEEHGRKAVRDGEIEEYDGELTLEDRIAHNEAMFIPRNMGTGLSGGKFKDYAMYDRLLPHPTILCMWSTSLIPEGSTPINECHRNHGDKPAIARRDMMIPWCKSCMIEDPYE